MRKVHFVILLMICLGCSTVVIPNYLPDKKPYGMIFYSDYDVTLKAITESLKALGWSIEQTTNPIIYEQSSMGTEDQKQVLVITEVRQTPMFLGTRYARINVFLRSKDNVSNIEIRYLTVTTLPFKILRSYNNNSAVERIFTRIGKYLTDLT